MIDESSASHSAPRLWPWKLAWFVVAVAYAWPVYWAADARVQKVNRSQRTQLIVRHQLWELDPHYAGTPQLWTRVAAQLLTDGQLLRRVHRKYGAQGREIELDYRRDLFIAQAEVVLTAAAAWALPLAVVYGIGAFLMGRRQKPAVQPDAPPATVDDSRYRP